MQTNDALGYPIELTGRGAVERLAFWATAAFGASIFWLAPHLPMVDLPQHAGQIALMRDLLIGHGRWADVVHINWFTPYLIGYLLALPLSLVLPISIALQILLSLGYLAFLGLCTMLRRHFGADPRLDWLALVPYLGLSYKWGFLTFLVAAPIALGLVLLSSLYAERPTLRRGLAVVAVGVVLLASHGLQFLFAWCTGVAFLMFRWRKARYRLAAFMPYALLAVLCGIYFLMSRSVEADFNVPYGYAQYRQYGLTRLVKFPLFAVGEREDALPMLPLVALLLAAPWAFGLRPRRDRAIACIPFAVVVSIMLLVPSFAMNTAFLYERFALYLLPTYGWIFAASRDGAAGATSSRQAHAAALGLAAVCAALLTLNALRVWNFGRETRALDGLIGKLEPFQRALILVFNGRSPAANNSFVYIHYPAWYQAERGGMVDFNFAWFPPQVVRFRPGHLPPWRPGLEWQPDKFDWHAHRGADYRYFFVRSLEPVPTDLFKGAECPPVRLWSVEAWTVFERQPCR